MKKLLSTCLLGILLTLGTTAQNHSAERFFNRYADKDGFVTVKISNPSPGLFNSDNDDPDLKIHSLRVLTVQDKELNKDLNFYNEIIPQIDINGYEQLITIKKKGENSILLCKKDRKRISEILFVSGGRNNVLVEITGSMSLEQAKTITKSVSHNNDNYED